MILTIHGFLPPIPWDDEYFATLRSIEGNDDQQRMRRDITGRVRIGGMKRANNLCRILKN